MKITLASDLHLEFGSITIKNDHKSDVLVLAGDVVPAKVLNKTYDINNRNYEVQKNAKNLFDVVSKEFENTIWVAGNHEFYGGKWNETLDTLMDWTVDHYSNVYFLEDNHVKVQDVSFYGCSLWTNQNNLDPLTMQDIEWAMNDYNHITYDGGFYRKLKSKDTVQRHQTSMMLMREFLNNHNNKTVVVTHHAPSVLSRHPRYPENNTVNWAYYSSLEEDILDFPQIALWCHGHTHEPHDYHIGTTRVVCNPRGYHYYETRSELFEPKTLEI